MKLSLPSLFLITLCRGSGVEDVDRKIESVTSTLELVPERPAQTVETKPSTKLSEYADDESRADANSEEIVASAEAVHEPFAVADMPVSVFTHLEIRRERVKNVILDVTRKLLLKGLKELKNEVRMASSPAEAGCVPGTSSGEISDLLDSVCQTEMSTREMTQLIDLFKVFTEGKKQIPLCPLELVIELLPIISSEALRKFAPTNPLILEALLIGKEVGIPKNQAKLVAQFFQGLDDESSRERLARLRNAIAPLGDDADSSSDEEVLDLMGLDDDHGHPPKMVRSRGFLQPGEGEIKSKLDGVRSQARFALVHRINSIINPMFNFPVGADQLNLIDSLIDVSIEIMSEPEMSEQVMSLADFWEEFESHRFLTSSPTDLEKLTLHLSFQSSRRFGISLLARFPQLLPGWSSERILTVRHIMRLFLFFGEAPKFDPLIQRSIIRCQDQTKLDQALSVLRELFEHRLENPESTPLVDPARWLTGFMTERLSFDVQWVHDLTTPQSLVRLSIPLIFECMDLSERGLFRNPYRRCDPASMKAIPNFLNLPNGCCRHIMDYLGVKFPCRFDNMMKEIASVPRINGLRGLIAQGQFTGGELYDYAIDLPRLLLVKELQLRQFDNLSPKMKAVEEAVLLFINLVRAVEKRGFHNLSQEQKQALQAAKDSIYIEIDTEFIDENNCVSERFASFKDRLRTMERSIQSAS